MQFRHRLLATSGVLLRIPGFLELAEPLAQLQPLDLGKTQTGNQQESKQSLRLTQHLDTSAPLALGSRLRAVIVANLRMKNPRNH